MSICKTMVNGIDDDKLYVIISYNKQYLYIPKLTTVQLLFWLLNILRIITFYLFNTINYNCVI